MKNRILKIVGIVVIVGVVGFAAIQLIRPGVIHHNPPVVQEPVWPSPEAKDLARRACFDCHSNETIWPWYANIAPISWLLAVDVTEGRRRLNFSEWNPALAQWSGELAGVTQEGEMPPLPYLLMHAGARLSAQEKEALITALKALK